jgi:hypothetical protein
MQAIGFQQNNDVEAYRERLRKMSDQKLIETGKAARYINSLIKLIGQLPVCP